MRIQIGPSRWLRPSSSHWSRPGRQVQHSPIHWLSPHCCRCPIRTRSWSPSAGTRPVIRDRELGAMRETSSVSGRAGSLSAASAPTCGRRGAEAGAAFLRSPGTHSRHVCDLLFPRPPAAPAVPGHTRPQSDVAADVTAAAVTALRGRGAGGQTGRGKNMDTSSGQEEETGKRRTGPVSQSWTRKQGKGGSEKVVHGVAERRL